MRLGMLRAALALTTATAFAAGLVVSQVQPAKATSVSAVPAVTIYKDANYGGASTTVHPYWDNLGLKAGGCTAWYEHQWSDCLSSYKVVNAKSTSIKVRFWTDANFKGSVEITPCIKPGWQYNQPSVHFNDQYTSVDWVSC